MSALGGSIEALLKLNISDFENNSKKAVSMAQDLQKGMNLNSTGIQKATSEVSNLNSGMTATEKSTNSLGSKLGSGLGINGIQKTSTSLQTLSSRIREAESFTSALGSTFTRTGNSFTPLVTDARALQSTFPRIAEGAVLSNKQMDIQASALSKSNAQIRQMGLTLPAFFSSMDNLGMSTASNMNKSASVMTGGWTRTTSAINTAGGAVKNIGSRIAEAASSMSMFSASLATMIGTMGTQQVYDATVGKANSYLGMIQYWNTVYGSTASQNYQNTVNSMYTQHYQAKSDTTRTLQLLSNTMPLGTDSSEISSLTPIVAAYKNFYKAMKPEQAAMANIEAPQDIAAVFSGNTGEIRASPLASQLKTVASLPQDQKMAALQDLFSKNGVMNYLDGITAYDKNMNKLNATMDNLTITTGEELIPAATNVLTKINDFLQGLGSNGKYLVYLTGAVAGLAALGGVGSLAVMGLSGVYKGLTTAGSGASWFGKKIGLLTDVLDSEGNKVGTGISSKVKNALSSVPGKVGDALKSVPGKVGSALSTVKDKASDALRPVADKAAEALNPVKTKIVDKLTPIADAAGTAMSGVKSSVITKLNELQTWINTSFHPTPTGGGGSVGTVERLATSGIPVVEGAAGAWLASKGMPLASRAAITAMGGLTSGALSPLSGLLAPATFGLFDKGGPYGPPYTQEDVNAAYQKSLQHPNPSVGEPSLLQQLDLPDWLAGNVFGPNKAKVDPAVTSANDWVKGAAGNTGSFFSWLGNTASGGVKGTNPVGWLKGAAGNTGSFFNWLGKTGNSGLGGGLGDINSFFSGIGKTGNDALGGFFGQFLPGGKGPQQSWLSQFLPGTSSAAGSGGNKGILNDITGKNGLLDFSRFIPKFTWPKISFSGIGQWIQSKIPKINWPKISLSGIGQWIQSKIPKLSWPNLSGIVDWVQSKIPKLNWKIPTLTDVKNFVWGKITSLNWKIPTLDDVKGWVWGAITTLNWEPHLPSAGEILTAIEHHIHDFVWPSGPGGVITGVVHRAEANFARIKAEKQAALAQSTTNAKTYVQTPTFKQKMNSDWGGLIGTGRGPRGPQEAKTTIKNIFSGFGYDDYEGSKKSIAETLNDGHANCFDLTLAEMYMGGQYGLDSEMVWSTWNGGSHVYPKIGGEVMDAAHYALNKSWTAPPKGPSDQDDSTKTNTISAAINQFPSSAVPKTGSKIGSSINNAIVKPITAAIQYSTKYVKGGVTQINTDFNALVPQATSAWTAVQNAVAGPINNIIGFVSKLRSAVGGSSTGSYAGGDIPAGTTPVLPNKTGTSKTPTFDLPLPTGTSAEKILESLYQGDEAGCPDCGVAGGDNYGIFNGATNWIGKVKNWAYGYAGAKLGLPINASTLSKPAGLFYNWVTKLFSGFNYQFYFDDQKSNAQTLAQKSGNCFDMTQLLMALANAFGIGSSMVHGTWDGTGIGHVWSYIDGLGAMDPTALVQRGTWTPPAGSAGGDFRAPSSGDTTYQLIVKVEGPVYGIDDLENKIEEGAEKVMNKMEAKLSLG